MLCFLLKKTLFDFPNKKTTKAKKVRMKKNYKNLCTQFQDLGKFHKTLNPKTQLQKQKSNLI